MYTYEIDFSNISEASLQIAGLEIMGNVLIAMMIICSVVALIAYVLGGLGLMRMADRLGIKNSFFAWLPVCNFYLIGKIAFGEGGLKWLLVALLALTCIPGAIGYAFLVGFYIALAFAGYKIFDKFSDKAILMTVFNVLTGTALSTIFFFAIRNNDIRDTAVVTNNTTSKAKEVTNVEQSVEAVVEETNVEESTEVNVEESTENEENN